MSGLTSWKTSCWRWGGSSLDDRDAVLIADEIADEKSSADCAGAARQYSATWAGSRCAR
jgi:hypothetical protein